MFQKLDILLIFAMLTLPTLHAQNEINSPYSGFGVGIVNKSSNGILDAMGGVSYAIQSPYFINFRNPASYAAFDSLTMVADVAASIYSTKLSTNGALQKNSYARPNYFTIGLPVTRHWRTSVGIIPFSAVGYDIDDAKTISNIGDISYEYSGSGGLMQLYWGNAFKIYKGLSLGLNTSYLFGSLYSTRIEEFDGDYFYNTRIQDAYYLDGIYLSAGLQYFFNVKQGHRLGIGLVYSNTAYIWSKENLLINYYEDSYSSVTTYDTVLYDTGNRGNLRIPQSVGAGLSYNYKDKILVGADVTWQNWSKYSLTGHSDSLRNALTASVGFQFVPDPLSGKFFRKMAFRLGAKYSTGEFVIRDTPISDMSFSVGLGIPLNSFNSHSTINVLFEYGKMGTLKNDLIKQNYFKFTFNFTLQEKWYQRVKLE